MTYCAGDDLERSKLEMLVNCPECSANVSDKAETCPHCGVGLNASSQIYEKEAHVPFFGVRGCLYQSLVLFVLVPALLTFLGLAVTHFGNSSAIVVGIMSVLAFGAVWMWGRKLSKVYKCSNCKVKLPNQEINKCPNCRTGLA